MTGGALLAAAATQMFGMTGWGQHLFSEQGPRGDRRGCRRSAVAGSHHGRDRSRPHVASSCDELF
jgi:hypothetical protein